MVSYRRRYNTYRKRNSSLATSMPKCLQIITPSLAVWDGMESVNWMTMANDCSSTACFTNYASQTHISWTKRPPPRLKHWHQLDLILMWRSYPENMLLKRSFQSIDCDTLTTTEEDVLLQASRQRAYQCHPDPELKQIGDICQVSEGLPQRKPTSWNSPAVMGCSQEPQP